MIEQYDSVRLDPIKENDFMPTYSAEWPVTTDGCDRKARITIPYLCSLLQETAVMHAENLGWGYTLLKEEGLQWVLSRQWLRMDRIPRWHESLRVETWPSGKSALTWNRDYRIFDENGGAIGAATSLWFVMDRESRRPKPAPFGNDMDLSGVEKVRENDLKALNQADGLERKSSVKAGYHDIDLHSHVNNVRYLKWMVDAVDPGFLDDKTLAELEINFLAEGFLGDELDVLTGGEEGIRDFSLKRRSDDTELCRMKASWI